MEKIIYIYPISHMVTIAKKSTIKDFLKISSFFCYLLKYRFYNGMPRFALVSFRYRGRDMLAVSRKNTIILYSNSAGG